MGSSTKESRVTWRGVAVCSRLAAQLNEVVAILTREGRGSLAARILPSQGSWSTTTEASKGTHSGCGAIDFDIKGLSTDDCNQIIIACRKVGIFSSYRPKIVGLWPAHIHNISCGCATLSKQALDQVDEYLAGYDGLVGNAKDAGPRNWVGVTWETYQAAHGKTQASSNESNNEEDDMVGYRFSCESGVYFANPSTGVFFHVPGEKGIEDLDPFLMGLKGVITLGDLNARQRDLMRDLCSRAAASLRA